MDTLSRLSHDTDSEVAMVCYSIASTNSFDKTFYLVISLMW